MFVFTQVQHLQKVLTKKRDPVTHVCFIDDIIKVRPNFNSFSLVLTILWSLGNLKSTQALVGGNKSYIPSGTSHLLHVCSTLSQVCPWYVVVLYVFDFCPCLRLACMHGPCWFTRCRHISSKWHSNWCLQVAAPLWQGYHAHTRAERIFSVKHYSQTVMKHFICSGWAYDHAGVCVVMVTGTLFAETRGMLFSFGISGICRFLSLERRIGGIRAGCLVAILC